MRSLVLVAAFAAVCLGGCARSQSSDDTGGGQSPEVRAAMQQARSAAKTASLNDLSSDHRARINDIVSKFNDGSLELDDASSQIDGVLSSNESQAILAEQTKMRAAMRQARAAAGSTSSGRNGLGGRRSADPGRFLLGVLADPDTFRAAMRSQSG